MKVFRLFKGNTQLLLFLYFFTFQYGVCQNLIPVTEGGFEAGAGFGANNWTVVNDVRNKWFVGGVSKCTGNSGAYIDSSSAGTSNQYHRNIASVSHFYRDVVFPPCQTNITLTFKYKGGGNSQGGAPADYLAVYLVPTSTQPQFGTALTTGSIGAVGYNLANACTQVTIQLPASAAGTTQRLIFSWINNADNKGTQPAITVDDILLTYAAGSLSNDEPCGATPVTVGSTCNFVTYNNTGSTFSTGYPNPTCGNYAGGDVWFTTTIPASGQLIIDANTDSITDGAMAVYTGPNASNLTEVACDDDGSINGLMPFINLTTLLPGSQVWIRFWESGGDVFGTFNICFYSTACPGGVPPNDLCANAIPIALGSTITGTTACATGTNETGNVACWLNGSLNTVWYSVVCPPSGRISLRTGLGTLTNTQMALYSGSCATLTELACSNDIFSCGSTQFWSEIVASNLTPGVTYYVRVDGYQSLNGDFTLTAIDGTGTWPTVFGQDCNNPFAVCSPNLNVGNPGFIGSGNNCDFNAGFGCPSCLLAGERNAVWYSFTASSAGIIQFLLTPNNGVDFDFALWDVTGLSSPCASISGGTLSPIRCSYAASFQGTATGLNTTAVDQCESANGDGFVSAINATAGQSFLLVISNFSTTYVGYNLNFFNSPLDFSGNIGNLTVVGDSNVCSGSTKEYAVVGSNLSGDVVWTTESPYITFLTSTDSSSIFCEFSSAFETGNICVTVSNSGCGDINVCIPITRTPDSPDLNSIVSPVTCNGGFDGSVSIQVNGNSGPRLIISEVHTDPSLNDSPYEWLELLVTRPTDFAQHPHTVVFSNNGTATTKGWVQGGIASPPPKNSTYAFLIDSGFVQAGTVVYVGGSQMTPAVNRIRVKNTSVENGDGGIGGPFVSSGVLGNGGGVGDGVAVFDKLVSQLDSSTVPVDAVFFGTSIGVAAMTDTATGFTLPINDLYSGGCLRSNSFCAPDILGAYSLVATGVFNPLTGQFTTPRTFTANSVSWNAPFTSINLQPIGFQWSTGSTSSLISGLSAGTYSVIISDSSGHVCTSTYPVLQPTALLANVSVNGPPCSGEEAIVTVSASGGVPPYSGLGSYPRSAGQHQFSISDANGCSITVSTTVVDPAPLLVNAVTSGILCFGNQATVTVSASGGTAPYTGIGLFSSPAGANMYSVTDLNGCSSTYTLNIVSPSQLVASAIASPILCGGTSTNLNVAASGGTPPYSGTGAFQVPAGQYSFTVLDSNGCVATASSSVSEPSPLIVSVQAGSIGCSGGSAGASSQVNGGTPPFTYNWSSGATVASLSGLTPGIYTLTVTDASGCTSSDLDTVVNAIDLLSLQLNAPSLPLCFGDSSATITSTVSGGLQPYSFVWSTGDTTPDITGVGPGNYALTLSDASGCTLQANAFLNAYPSVVFSVFNPPSTNVGLEILLQGSNLGSTSAILFNGASASSFSVLNDSLILAVVPSSASTGPITLVDSNGCQVTSPVNFNLLTDFSKLTVKLFIEGLYAGNEYMDLPLVNSGYASDGQSVDTLEVLLYNPGDLTNPVVRQKRVLNTLGLVDYEFPGYCLGNSYWIVLRQRNSIETWSKQPVQFALLTYYNFSSQFQWPVVITAAVSSVNSTSAFCGGNVVSDGGATLLAYGVCWSTSPDPTVSLQSKTIQQGGTGPFTSTITGLQSNTTYYARAYATNSVGTVYGANIQFSTANILPGQVTDVDGHVYDTVIIGTQTWLRQNLKTSKYRNGAPIPTITDSVSWSGTDPIELGAWCYYRNDSSFNSTFGKLYNWYAVNDTAICPVGYRVPSSSDWNVLLQVLDQNRDPSCLTCPASYFAGGLLKATGFQSWAAPNQSATNSTGFTALAAGCRKGNIGPYYYGGQGAYFWSSTPVQGQQKSISIALEYITPYVMRYPSGNQDGFSVRCIKD